MDIEELYNKLVKIFVDHTTHNWKNGWQHEGDRLSTELYIQKNVQWNNMFLLQKIHGYARIGFILEGPNEFKVQIKKEDRHATNIRVDINRAINDKIYYYINESEWEACQLFIVELCQTVYDSNVAIKQVVNNIPSIYGESNPSFLKEYKRDLLLNNILNN